MSLVCTVCKVLYVFAKRICSQIFAKKSRWYHKRLFGWGDVTSDSPIDRFLSAPIVVVWLVGVGRGYCVYLHTSYTLPTVSQISITVSIITLSIFTFNQAPQKSFIKDNSTQRQHERVQRPFNDSGEEKQLERPCLSKPANSLDAALRIFLFPLANSTNLGVSVMRNENRGES